jgi:hypothetical protein
MTDLSFTVVDARVDRYAAAPSILLRVAVSEGSGARIDALVLRAQIQLEVQRRRYLPQESALLVELFGDTSRYADTLKPMLWAHVAQTVPSFEGTAEFDVALPCSYDFDVAANKYLSALKDGIIPLNVLFSGTIFVDGPAGVTAERVSWSCETRYALPVATWRAAMDAFFPNSAWIRVDRDLFDELRRFKSATGMPTWNAALERLCEAARTQR